MKKILAGLVSFVVAGIIVFFGIQFFTKTGIFHVPGKLIFSEDFPEEEKKYFSDLLAEIELDSDLELKIVEREGKPNENSGNVFLIDAFVPTTDFYSTENVISAVDFRTLYEMNDPSIISVRDLTSKLKLLAVDNPENYFLETFSTGAIFKWLEISGNSAKSIEDYAAVAEKIIPTLENIPTEQTTLSFAQTGVTALSRGMNAKLAQVGNATYFAENIGEFLSSFDLTHTSNESSFTDSANASNICSDWDFVDTLTAIGLDIVELTGNHNQDCGDTAALETLDKYGELGIKTVGGGQTAEEASIPLQISEKGNDFTFLAYNQSTGGATLDNTPGANQYYPEKARAEIAEAKARGDTVIVDMQYYECSGYASTYEDTTCDYAWSAAGDQVGVFRELIDMGADIVVGTSAHQTQTFESYNDGEIYYGLGNLFFDQIWWPGTTRSLGLVQYFYNNQLIQTRRFGTVYDADMQTRLMTNEELEQFIERLNLARNI